MRINRVGAIASFVLTVEFLLTLWWLLASWPPEGFAGLADAMARMFIERAHEPLTFAMLNLYNVSFAVPAVVLAVVIRRQFPDYPVRMELMVHAIVVAAGLFVASGLVPLLTIPDLVSAGDASGLRTTQGVATGLLLGATMACGFAVCLAGWVGFSSRRLPFLLSSVLVVSGLIEIFEWAVPQFLLLDPLLGAFWSVWLGGLLWADRVAGTVPSHPRLATGEGATT